MMALLIFREHSLCFPFVSRTLTHCPEGEVAVTVSQLSGFDSLRLDDQGTVGKLRMRRVMLCRLHFRPEWCR
jgi:hypothetical protein